MGAADRDRVHALLTQEPVRRHLLDGEIVSREFIAKELSASSNTFTERGWGLWGVLLDGVMIGVAGFRHVGTPPESQLAYAIEPTHWGHGYAREAVGAVVDHARETLRHPTVVAVTDATNLRSAHLLRQLGFQPTVRYIQGRLDLLRFERE